MLNILCESKDLGKNGSENAFSYLKSISDVKRFNALTMFMTSNDKQSNVHAIIYLSFCFNNHFYVFVCRCSKNLESVQKQWGMR